MAYRLYAVLDKKSACAEYFIANCDEDACRIFGVMMSASRTMYDFADDFALELVQELKDVRTVTADTIIIDGFEIKRRLDALMEDGKNAET